MYVVVLRVKLGEINDALTAIETRVLNFASRRIRKMDIVIKEQFQSVTGVDPFTYVTIASACMAVYRSGHIKPKTIAMIPVQGYCNSTNFSRDSIRWLDFVAHTEGHRILHALNGTGEQKIAGYSVDGFCKETNTVYQYQIYEVYHFLSSSNNLFRSFIDLFLQMKQEASGYPKECLTEKLKSEYIMSYSEKENIYLDKNSINIENVFLPTPEIAAFQWTQSNNFATQDISTNIFIVAFTTCHARLKLYSEIEKLNESVLYFDMNSVIYKSDGIDDPPLGNFLGEFTDELNGRTITSFVTGEPKNYAYKLSDGSEVCKIR
ncbi:uncharacterized protein TNIN_76811 [Trichonephila inaurata madagascariensis]|uniref:DNA-directed DNA polymerase n=1 Tax=Trichonephila inaurata madagascariensis TaxID=2747483 RepID=A0A8X6XBF9_9ARAC|nr:uncharacterized protein TNIN_76811 [Trichonephila inaurata madagascariensis]